jgi:hypothetical protein
LQWTRIIWFYCLKKAWCKLNMKWTKNITSTTSIGNLKVSLLNLYLYYAMKPFIVIQLESFVN